MPVPSSEYQHPEEVKSAKAKVYQKTVADLQKNPGQLYSCLKRITAHDQMSEKINIDEISHLSDQQQAEIIAEKFSSIQNEFEPIKSEDINIPPLKKSDTPQLAKLKTNKATVPGDFPAKLIKQFAAYLAEPLTDVINTSIERGEYPQLYKLEISTP